MRKPNPFCRLQKLPAHDQAWLADCLLKGMPYHEAQKVVASKYGLTVSLPSFSHFWTRVCSPMLLARRIQAVKTAQEIGEAAEKHPAAFDQGTIDQIKQKAFELAISPQADPKDVKALFTLILKLRDQDLELRRIRVLELRAAQADQAQEVVSSPLTPDEKAARMLQIFGLAGKEGA